MLAYHGASSDSSACMHATICRKLTNLISKLR